MSTESCRDRTPSPTSRSYPFSTAFSTVAGTPSCSQQGMSSSTPTSRSVPPTPEGPVALAPSNSGSCTPLLLPRTPPLSLSSAASAALADVGNVGRERGLMRRLSRGTHNRIRRGPSSNNMREQNSGSVVVRQPNGARPADLSFDMSDYELDDDDDEQDHPITPTSPKTKRSRSALRATPKRLISRHLDGGAEPAVPLSLLQANHFTKFTRRKEKKMLFWLDETRARISWATSLDRSRKTMHIDHIKELRAGPDATGYLQEFSQPAEHVSRWLTVIYIDSDSSKGRATKSLHLLADDEKTRRNWVQWLAYLMRSRGDMMASIAGSSEAHREKVWSDFIRQKASKESAGYMDFQELKSICRKYAINKSERDLRQRFDEVDVDATGRLGKSEFLSLFRKLAERRDLKHLFDDIKSSDYPFLQRAEFMTFLRDQQGIDVAAGQRHWDAVFDSYQATPHSLGIFMPEATANIPIGMSWESFQDFMNSDYMPWCHAARRDAKLDRPLNEYFISSSHNTYLMGRQVGGISDAEGYVEALRKGCRSVEVDCWDGDDGRPCVTHGRTLTTKVSFEDCIRTINTYAFYSTPYPLIVSLEVHCCAEQQQIMADIMKQHFGHKLILKPLRNDCQLPTPEELKNRILVKVKKAHVNATAPNSFNNMPTHRRQRSQSEPQPGAAARADRKLSTPSPNFHPLLSPSLKPRSTFDAGSSTDGLPSGTLTSAASSVVGTSEDDSDLESVGDASSTKRRKPKTSNIIRSLGDMGVYTRGIKFTDFRSPESRTYDHIYSFNENTFEARCKPAEQKRMLEDHNMRCLMRVYPKAHRITSTNFDPLQFWRRGVQMVATNWQTRDLGTQINDAMFAVGLDRTGYVLKPEELRASPLGWNWFNPAKLVKKSVKFTVKIISARRLARTLDMHSDSEMNPYVEFEMYSAEDKGKGIATSEGGLDASARNGMSGIGSPVRKRTKIIQGNGFDPIWDESVSMTVHTKYPSLIFVRCTIWNSTDGKTYSTSKEPLARFTAKLTSIQQGFRHFSLERGNDEHLLSQLFCQISKEEPRDVLGPRSFSTDASTDTTRSSEESTRSGGFFRSIFQRTPSERRPKQRREPGESGYFSRTTSTER